MCFVCALTICKLCSWKVTKKRGTLDHPGTVAWNYRQLWVTLWVLGTERCLFQEQHALLNTKLFLKAQAWLTAGKKKVLSCTKHLKSLDVLFSDVMTWILNSSKGQHLYLSTYGSSPPPYGGLNMSANRNPFFSPSRSSGKSGPRDLITLL